MITLRADQATLKNNVYTAWQEPGVRNVLAVLPTGGGKSVIASDIVGDFTRLNTNSAVIAHRQELVGQLSLHVGRAAVKHRIIAPRPVIGFITALHREEFGRSFIDPNARTAVVGVDTLVSRKDQLAPWCAQVGHWMIDEAHHVLQTNKWGIAAAMFPNAFGLGVTATPERADGRGLGRDNDGVFDRMVIGPTMRELIDAGYLTDYSIVVPQSDFDVSNLKITDTGDFSQKQMREEAKRSHIVGDAVEQYIKFANGKLCVVFAIDVETARETAEAFNAAGIAAVSISAKTDDAVRVEYLRRFRRGEIRVLVNVDLFGEGFDLPAIECVIMARPTASLAVYLQQFGRALRTLSGKTIGLVIDLVSNVKRHGLPDKTRFWSLDRRDKRARRMRDPEDIPVKTCRNAACLRSYPGELRSCPYCGFVPVPAGGGRSVQEVDGDLMLLDANVLNAMRKAAQLVDPGQIAARLAGGRLPNGAVVGQVNRQIERIEAQRRLSDTIALWAGYQRSLGREDSEIHRRFYHGTGGVDVVSALGLPRVDMDKLDAMVREWLA